MLRSEIAFLPLAIFLVYTMITPGPNNITGASMGILHGYRKSYKYVLGVGAGFFFIMLLSGLLSGFLLKYIPGFERIVRILGALYILWMAFGLLRSSLANDLADQPLLGFSKGLFLQFLNPKVMVIGLDPLFFFFGIDHRQLCVAGFVSRHISLPGVYLYFDLDHGRIDPFPEIKETCYPASG